ncbi:MAG: F0F1 ATP synthase subunit delta [Methylococcales bacterium]|nr:F0F1 ATP synthase subunit delta [Methylococcales bacterium]
MEFNLSTFSLEIINFLILIWILQRLFYKPVLAAIAKRKQFIEQALNEANAMKLQAEAQHTLYENRLKLWAQEKQAALNGLHEQIDAERKTLMAELEVELNQERQKLEVNCQRQQNGLIQLAQQQALQNGARFAAMLLTQAASPTLEASLLGMLMDNLKTLPEACLASMQALGTNQPIPVSISSAYPLTDEQKRQLEQKLDGLANNPLSPHYHQDTALIAGIRVDIGAWVLNANLQYELTAFAEMANESE